MVNSLEKFFLTLILLQTLPINLFLRLNFYIQNILQTAMGLWESEGVWILVVYYTPHYSLDPQTTVLFNKASEQPYFLEIHIKIEQLYTRTPLFNICLSSEKVKKSFRKAGTIMPASSHFLQSLLYTLFVKWMKKIRHLKQY